MVNTKNNYSYLRQLQQEEAVKDTESILYLVLMCRDISGEI
jgi:hypothetical protein